MHREFHRKHLRADRSGVDYDAVRDYDTQGFIAEKLYEPLAQRLRRAIDRQDKAALSAAVNEAMRVKLQLRPTPEDPKYKDLVQRARELSGRLMHAAP